jgi:hypothetical protein
MAALVLLLLTVWMVVAARAAVRRRSRAAAGPRADFADRLLAATVRLLPAERADWGQAMIGELEHVDTRPERRRFAVGCLVAALLAPRPRPEAGRPFVAVVLGAIAVCLALVGFGLVRYPGLITGAGTWLAVGFFIAVLAGYAGLTLVITRRAQTPGSLLRSAGIGGVLVAATCFLVGLAATLQPPWFIPMSLLLLVPLVSIGIGALGARRGRREPRPGAVGLQTAALSGVVAGLFLFILWVGTTMVSSGAPYDAGQLRDFSHSGAPDLATYAVSDNLGAGMMLLILVPLMTVTLGGAGAAITSRLQHRRTG